MKLLAVARGEIVQRLRDPGFLVLLVALAAGTTYLAPSPDQPYTTLGVDGSPLFGGSGLAGTSAGLDFGVFAGFFCIFALHGGFARDDRTRLSELLRAQPFSTVELVLGRLLASWVLGTILVVGGMLLLGVSLMIRERAAFDGMAYLRNFFILAFPTTCLVASFAVVLDVLLGRWRGWLVAAGLIGYIALLSASGSQMEARNANALVTDFGGMLATQIEFWNDTGSKKALDVGLDIGGPHNKPIPWNGLKPESGTVMSRVLVVAEAAIFGLFALICYRRRAGVTIKGLGKIESAHGRIHTGKVFDPPLPAHRPSFVSRLATECALRLRKNWLPAACSAGLFAFALLGARVASHWVIALAMLYPLFWIRTFNDATRPRSLDEVLAALPGGRDRDIFSKFATMAVFCVLPMLGLLLGNPSHAEIWLAATAGIVVEIAWLVAVAWIFGAELLALGVMALWWYLIAFNDVPAPIDFMGMWSAPAITFIVDAIAFAALATVTWLGLRQRNASGVAR